MLGKKNLQYSKLILTTAFFVMAFFTLAFFETNFLIFTGSQLHGAVFINLFYRLWPLKVPALAPLTAAPRSWEPLLGNFYRLQLRLLLNNIKRLQLHIFFYKLWLRIPKKGSAIGSRIRLPNTA